MGGLRVLHRPLGWARALFVSASAAIPFIAKLPIPKVTLYLPQVVGIVRWCDLWVWVAAPACVGLATATGFFRRKIVDPEDAQTLQDLLNHLHDQMFPNDPDERSRVTLFRFQRWQFKRWPWRPEKGGWLIAVKRSGEMQQDFKARFMVGEELTENCGIAGKAWCDIADAIATGLPDVCSGKPKQRAIKLYAKQTCTSPEWVRAKRPRSRSFYAIKVRRKSKKWGVIVIDSSDPQLNQELIVQVFSNTQRFLSLYATKV